MYIFNPEVLTSEPSTTATSGPSVSQTGGNTDFTVNYKPNQSSTTLESTTSKPPIFYLLCTKLVELMNMSFFQIESHNNTYI